MRTFECNEIGKVAVIHLSKGELLLESLTKALADMGIKNGIVTSGIGSLRKLSYHGIKSCADHPDDYFAEINAPMELGAMQGIVLEGVPHIHLICSTPDGKHYTGHLEPGSEVQFLAEISVVEVKDMLLTRRLDEFGIGYIDKL